METAIELVMSNQQGRDITTSLLVAEVFQKRHDNVLRDIRNLECSDEFRLANFELLVEMRQLPQGGATKAEWYEMTKDGFSFLVMGYTGKKAAEFKELFIREFNKRESLLKDEEYIIQRSMEIINRRVKALEAAVETKSRQLALQGQVIIEQAPKVAYHDKVLQSTTLHPITIIAKEMGLSAVTLNRMLMEAQVIYKSGKTYVLYARYANKGYTGTKTYNYMDSMGNERTTVEMRWTEKGREFIHNLFSNK